MMPHIKPCATAPGSADSKSIIITSSGAFSTLLPILIFWETKSRRQQNAVTTQTVSKTYLYRDRFSRREVCQPHSAGSCPECADSDGSTGNVRIYRDLCQRFVAVRNGYAQFFAHFRIVHLCGIGISDRHLGNICFTCQDLCCHFTCLIAEIIIADR